MKFTSYFISLKHESPSFTGKISKNEELIVATFIKVEKNIYIIHFTNQYEFCFFEKTNLKSSNEEITFLSPAISKYNKRKLSKLCTLLENTKPEDNAKTLLNLLSVENFLKCSLLLNFFKIERESFAKSLTKKEIQHEIKIIDVNLLYLTSYENYITYLKELNQFILNKYNKREKSFKVSEIELSLKLPKESIFFKYLLYSLKEEFSFTISNDRITFFKLSLTRKDLENIKIIETEINSRTGVFSLEEMIKKTGLALTIVNDSVWNLIEERKIVQLNKKFFISNSELIKIINKLKKYKRNQGETISIKLFRDLTNYTRKNIIVIMEYLDQEKITVRIDDNRKILLPV